MACVNEDDNNSDSLLSDKDSEMTSEEDDDLSEASEYDSDVGKHDDSSNDDLAKNFRCDLCPKKYKLKAYLDIHKRTNHEGNQSWKH